MPTKKIADFPTPCLHPEHNASNMVVYQPGIYEHTCPECGRGYSFSVKGSYMDITTRGDWHRHSTQWLVNEDSLGVAI